MAYLGKIHAKTREPAIGSASRGRLDILTGFAEGMHRDAASFHDRQGGPEAMTRTSAGLLMYRRREGALEVLLVHPGGPFWVRKDAGAWSIPKGEIDPMEDPLAAARREFAEETGFAAEGRFQPLAPITQAGGKIVQAWAFEGDADPAALQSNRFSIEWPPRSGRQRSFPEVDRAAWFALDVARQKIHPAQVALLDELAASA